MDIEQYSKQHIYFYSDDVPKLLEQYLRIADFSSFADIGCGDGALLYALNKREYFKNKKVYAVDLSKTRIKRVQEINNEFKCTFGDACNTRLPDQSIDFLVSMQVIEHVPDDSKMIQEIARILSKDGIVYLSTVFKKWYGWYFYRCDGKWRLDPTHLREYSVDSQLLGIIKKDDFEVLENKKTLFWFSISDFILRKLKSSHQIYLNNRFFQKLRIIKLPIIGYYNWELIFRRKR
ncbi:MAG: class I SAM-dependent methyltransferase [Actinomycetota bacterium]|nr:class I SAM-dependent methyltransferase [Actinomycetota bacterium]